MDYRGAITIAALLGAALFWSATNVFPHDATPTAAKPNGWAYPWQCCSGIDCREVPESSIGELPSGYEIKVSGEIIPYGDKRIKDSPDGAFHWCSVQGKNDGKTICLFVPPRSF